jgi:hypothetical protein
VGEDTRRQTTVRIEESLLKAIKVEDATGPARLSLTDAIDEGLRLVLAQRTGGKPAALDSLDGLEPKDRHLMTRSAAFLRSDSALRGDFRKIVGDMLNLFERMSR